MKKFINVNRILFITLLLCVSSCTKDEDVQGCTDSSANNYNAEATIDNGSCAYDVADDYVGTYDIVEMQTVNGMTNMLEYAISISKIGSDEIEIVNFINCVPLEAIVSETSVILTNLNSLPFGDCFIDNFNMTRNGNVLNYTCDSKSIGIAVNVEGSATKQ